MHQSSTTQTSKRAFARHFGEMVIAMLVGMGVLSGLAALLFAAFGSSLSDQSGEFRVMLMGFNMTVPMIAWMRYRGHGLARNVEMAGSMVVPSLLAAVLAWTALLGAGGALALQHAVMVPAMLGVMLWRYDEYAHDHRRGPRVKASTGPSSSRTSPATRL
jgi:hypothetical protein